MFVQICTPHLRKRSDAPVKLIRKQAINDKLQDSVGTYLSCGKAT